MAGKKIRLESRYIAPRYSDLKLPSTGQPLQFYDSQAVIDEEDLGAVQSYRHYGPTRDFCIRGQLAFGRGQTRVAVVVNDKGGLPVAAAREGEQVLTPGVQEVDEDFVPPPVRQPAMPPAPPAAPAPKKSSKGKGTSKKEATPPAGS